LAPNTSLFDLEKKRANWAGCADGVTVGTGPLLYQMAGSVPTVTPSAQPLQFARFFPV
jgi:hypothetical protein